MIEDLTLRGFKSYRGRQTVRFTQGVNKISGRNASGKTTLLEAVLFGLFGDVPGVNKQDLVPLGGSELDVTVSLRSPFTGQGITVHREGGLTRDGGFRTSKSILKVEGEDHPYTREREIQTKLRELLSIGKNTFFNVVYAQQKEFVEILRPPRGRMDAILGLTTPAEIREQFREVRRMLETRGRIDEKGTLEERIRNAEQAIAEGERQLEEVSARKAELSMGLKEKRAELSVARGTVETLVGLEEGFRELEKAQTYLEVLRGRREDREQDLAELYEALGARPGERRQELQADRRAAEATEERLRRLVEEDLGGERRGLDAEVARLEHQVREHSEFREQGLTVCPKCGQEIDYDLIEGDLEKWREQLEAKGRRLAGLEREIKAIRDQVRVAHDRWIEADRAVTRFVEQERRVGELTRALEDIVKRGASLAERIERETEGALHRAESELAAAFASLEDARERVDERLRAAREELAGLQADVLSKETLLRDAERREGEIRDRLGTHREVLDGSRVLLDRVLEYEAKIQSMEAIQRHYGEYEQQLRENTLRLLEYQTYNYFRRLTDQQAYSACHIDRQRYALEVQPIGGSRLLPAWLAGGGHESLFALAERLALLRVMGFPHLLILDEPTDAVDSENIPQLLEYIARSGREIGQVLLVTHHGHGEEEGVNLISVKKVGGESRVYQEMTEETLS
jgi:DNA repair exonuclease SbcCD ATPase subunit